jgi:hypothetical protein
MRRYLLVWALIGVLLPISCGSDSSEPSSEGATEATVSSQVSDQVAQAETCLAESDLQNERDPDKAFGVEVPFEKVNVNLEAAAGDAYTASLYFFNSPRDAEDSRPIITLNSEDDLRNHVTGNVLVYYSIVPDKDDARAVEGCVTG